ncbi:MAG: hypothetical protein VCE74_01505 [Alphaproteobacteria bacterium]
MNEAIAITGNRYCFAWLNLLFRMRTIITPHWRYLGQPHDFYWSPSPYLGMSIQNWLDSGYSATETD